MMRRKREEVCGKPTQYNLETLEYDWKELPDTHYKLPQQAPKVRGAAGMPSRPAAGVAYGNNNGNNGNANNQQRNQVRDVPVPPSPAPLPAPAYPIQENYDPLLGAGMLDPGLYGQQNNWRNGGGADFMNGNGNYRGGGGGGFGAEQFGQLQQQQEPALHIPPWSHDEIRRMVHTNNLEAQRSYLNQRM